MGGGGYYVGTLLPRTEVSYTRNAPDVQLAYGPLFCEGYLSSCWLAMATDVYLDLPAGYACSLEHSVLSMGT